MGTSQANRLENTKSMNRIPSSLKNPERNASTVVYSVLQAKNPLLNEGKMAFQLYLAAIIGNKFLAEAQHNGIKNFMKEVPNPEKFLAAKIAKSLWDNASSKMDRGLSNSAYGKITELAFRKTISSILTKGKEAMDEANE